MTTLEASEDQPPLLPARMLNEYTYCPRLFFLEWVDGEFSDNYFTVHGRSVHARSDKPAGALPDADELAEDDPFRRLRSVTVSSETEGIITRVDVLEVDGGAVEPVEFKRGKPPPVPERAWEPERVQVCAQALVLRDNGYRCERAWLYFAGSKERVAVSLDESLVARTRQLVQEARVVARRGERPPPLVHSKKCVGCSLSSICLPDEVTALTDDDGQKPRRLIAPREDAVPLYVRGQGQRLGISGGLLRVYDRDGTAVCEARLEHTSQVCVYGGVQVSTPAIRELCNRHIALCFFSYGGWFYGRIDGLGHKNIELRRHQYRVADDPQSSAVIARTLVQSKVLNARTLLRRNCEAVPARALRDLKNLADEALDARDAQVLLGIEGSAARIYFGHFSGMLKKGGAAGDVFDMNGRNRRPPRDPINALLSFTYALLAKDCTLAVLAAGFEPYLGFYHRPRYGRPALALDLMEEFRPLIAESVVLALVNNGIVAENDFLRSGYGVALKQAARKRVLETYERRMEDMIKHPVFGYRISYRRVLAVQARLLARYILGEINEPPKMRTR